MSENLEFLPDRRRCLRQIVHSPAFASFDGVSGGMILDLSEEGLSMQTAGSNGSGFADSPLQRNQAVRLDLDLSEPSEHLETTGYIAWADALGRAGVRFSDLPAESRRRLNDWLTANAASPSRTAPKIALNRLWAWGAKQDHVALSLESESEQGLSVALEESGCSTVQYEFTPLSRDLAAALLLIAKRARALTRGTSAAIALAHNGSVLCRASVGNGAPGVGAPLDMDSGISGECLRSGMALRCDDAELDARVNLQACRRLGVRSILAAPVRYERSIVGLVMVMAAEPFNFDEGDVAIAESLAHTVVRTMRHADALPRGA
ncbi:MAG TPA: GAF domain-containing protein [Candidatus Binatia bacterium]|nr:GAF domain-containing protein [Candidatus Binatia bacterium]